MTHNLNLPQRPPPPPTRISPPRPQIPPYIKPTAIRPILSPISIITIISIKQPLLPNIITTDKIIPIIIPNLINLRQP